jgi:hypothetical protein
MSKKLAPTIANYEMALHKVLDDNDALRAQLADTKKWAQRHYGGL